MSDIEKILSRKSVVTAAELQEDGFNRKQISRLVRSGRLEREIRGVYRDADFLGVGFEADLAFAASAWPDAVMGLTAAAYIHELTTAIPRVIAFVPRGVKEHALDATLIRTRHSERLAAGIETHRFHGVGVAVTTPARTVVDFLRYADKGSGMSPCEDLSGEVFGAFLERGGKLTDVAELARRTGDDTRKFRANLKMAAALQEEGAFAPKP